MIKLFPVHGSGKRARAIVGAVLTGALAVAAAAPSHAQDSAVQEYGEVPGVEGVSKAVVTVDKGNYATLIAVARASGGEPIGEGIVERAGIGVDIYVDDEICTADRDVRRNLNADEFEGKFATSATCMTVLGPGEHTLLAERVSVNVEGAKMTFKYTILGGKPDTTNVPE